MDVVVILFMFLVSQWFVYKEQDRYHRAIMDCIDAMRSRIDALETVVRDADMDGESWKL